MKECLYDKMLTCVYCLSICFYPEETPWLEIYLERVFGTSFTADLLYKIKQGKKHPKTDIFEPLPSENYEYYQDIYKRAAEYSWSVKESTFEKQTNIFSLNKGKTPVNNIIKGEDSRVEYIFVEWLDMEEKIGKKKKVKCQKEGLFKDEKTSSNSPLNDKISRAQYVPIKEDNMNTQKHGIANFGFGVIHIYRDGNMLSAKEEWDGEGLTPKDKIVAILAVPSYMSTYDFLGFVGEDVKNQLTIRRTSAPNRYMVLLKFRQFKSAKAFYKAFNGKSFNSTEPEKCHTVFIKQILFQSKQNLQKELSSSIDDSILPVFDISETSQTMSTLTMPIASSTFGLRELPTCVVCLERMDASVTGLLTILCQHTFHCQCLSKWGENNCPVCRYSQQKDVLNAARINSQCSVCDSQENLWICLICGHIGCGRYDLAHAYDHHINTGHCYVMDMETERIWDYVGDCYVHRLIPNKIDGNLLKFPSTSYAPNTDSSVSEQNYLDMKEKMESMSLEYTYLLTSQLELQRIYYENKIAAAMDKAKKALESEKHVNEEMNNLMKKISELETNFNDSQKKINELKLLNSQNEKKLEKSTELARRMEKEWKEEKLLNSKLMHRIEHLNIENNKIQLHSDNLKLKIEDLSDQLRDVMFFISSQKHLDTMDDAQKKELQEGTTFIPKKPKKKIKNNIYL
ncbi:hypothetical protein T552_03213 [Pneumocystis carinii B80]|uniref:BRCA1-associated protein n=1 Tax=Pneumocystis carinii (strain B80) TaxID=1408658 RepID=A0A0W4ZC87_PNEC8|nr:hypothetical protein T552_03213 [Pneumocystis carinii B80]KTW25939.1 hypothetical protein T552_03213 [Pneumocystis carinii B80]